MQDTQLYQQILGLTEPWFVSRIELVPENVRIPFSTLENVRIPFSTSGPVGQHRPQRVRPLAAGEATAPPPVLRPAGEVRADRPMLGVNA
jgi:hypothetical protein